MADPHHHSVSSAKAWGGEPEDYLEVHRWFDATKGHFSDPRHRAIRHHSMGVEWAIEVFGQTITISTGKKIPVRWIAERHILEDFGRIPTVADFLREMEVKPWMVRGARKLSIELGKEERVQVAEPIRDAREADPVAAGHEPILETAAD